MGVIFWLFYNVLQGKLFSLQNIVDWRLHYYFGSTVYSDFTGQLNFFVNTIITYSIYYYVLMCTCTFYKIKQFNICVLYRFFKILISQDFKKVSITFVCNFVSVCLFKNNSTGHHTMAIAKILKYDNVCNFWIKCTYYVLIVRGERLALSNIDEW